MSTTPTGTSGTRSAATRYLCAAAHLDEAFRRRAIDELLFQPHRAVAPSFGVDIVPVLRHALLAHRRVLIRDGILTALWLFALFVIPAAAWSIWLFGLLVWAIVSVAGLRLRGTAASASPSRQVGCLAIFAVAAGVLIFGSLLSSVALGIVSPLSRVADLLSYGGYVPVAVIASLALNLLFPILMLATLFAYRALVHTEIVDSLQPEPFARRPAPTAPRWAEERLSYLADAQSGNVTYVAETAQTSPFVGSGGIDFSVSFAVPLVRRPDTNDLEALTATAVYQQLRTSIVGLGHPNTPPDRRYSLLRIQDRLYVSGRLRPESPFLTPPPARPRPRVEPGIVNMVTAGERGEARHYLVVRVATWSGEVETSILFYVAIRGDMLYLECTGTTLPPIAARYHDVDSYERFTPLVATKSLGKSVLDLVLVAPAAPLRLVSIGGQHLQRRQLQNALKGEARRRLAFDYGSRLSLRELGTGTESWFAATDAIEIQKVILRRAVAAVTAILDERGYDLAEFETRSNIIINNSTTNMRGATITGSNIATGSASTAVLSPGDGAGGATKGT